MKRLFILAIIIFFGYMSFGQGVSFSYLIPKNGYLSAPVSPFSVRGIGLGNKIGVETGATLYSIPGLAMEKLPFEYEKPLTGPHYALLVPMELFFKIPLGPMQIKLLGGGFGWWNINTRINEGNMDRAFRDYEGWEVLNSDFKLEDQLGLGWMAGIEFEFKVNDNFSITAESQYLKGAASSHLSGSYTGGTTASGIQTKAIDLEDTAILLEGIEFSIGVKFSK
ncbi:hypothetical protein [Marinoscillum sp. 108]|uniref:hypothetical protein n=1 Tax=Marinoscillum sp. 108 TaxID=2653151 RepID=UPI0012F09B74|nr:hypothetical protein [Marinoscillum sp. 108]VXD12521.1 conserved hypothetical protein [Marinoscillum sp. 108]